MKLSDIGPGLLLAATGIGVGDMVSATIAGAEYGLTLIWALGAGVLIKFAITEGAARWQLSTDTTLVEGWRNHLPRVAVAAFFIYFIVWSYMVSSALVAASARQAAYGTPIDRESAREKLAARLEQGAAKAEEAKPDPAKDHVPAPKPAPKPKATKQEESTFEKVVQSSAFKDAMRTAAREIVRGMFSSARR